MSNLAQQFSSSNPNPETGSRRAGRGLSGTRGQGQRPCVASSPAADGEGGACNTPGKSDRSTGSPSEISHFTGVSGAGNTGDAFTPPPPGSQGRAAWSALRGAVDWWTDLLRPRVDQEVWDELVWLAESEQLWEIPTGDAPLRLTLAKRGISITAKGDGLYIVIAAPDAPEAKIHYGAEVQWQGKLLSASATGLDVISTLTPWIWSSLYPSAADTREGVVEALQKHSRVGRVDYACDVICDGEGAESAIDSWYAGESHTRVLARFATHCRSSSSEGHTALLGDRKRGRTWYVGSTAMYRVYERSKHTQDGHWEILTGTLKQLGWDGKVPVLRAEVEVKREWQQTQSCECSACAERLREAHAAGQLRDAEVWPIREWTQREALAHAAGLAASLFERTRDTDDTGELAHAPPKERPTSPMWTAVQACPARIVDGSVEGVVTKIRSVQAKLFRAKRIKTALRAIEDLRTVGATADDAAHGSSATETVAVLLEAMRSAEEQRQRDAKLVSSRLKCTDEELGAARHRIDSDLRRAATARARAGCESLKVGDRRLAEITTGLSADWDRVVDAVAVLRGEVVVVAAKRAA